MTLYVCTLCEYKTAFMSGAIMHENIGHNGALVILEER
jgi:hypothetical protein